MISQLAPKGVEFFVSMVNDCSSVKDLRRHVTKPSMEGKHHRKVKQAVMGLLTQLYTKLEQRSSSS